MPPRGRPRCCASARAVSPSRTYHNPSNRMPLRQPHPAWTPTPAPPRRHRTRRPHDRGPGGLSRDKRPDPWSLVCPSPSPPPAVNPPSATIVALGATAARRSVVVVKSLVPSSSSTVRSVAGGLPPQRAGGPGDATSRQPTDRRWTGPTPRTHSRSPVPALPASPGPVGRGGGSAADVPDSAVPIAGLTSLSAIRFAAGIPDPRAGELWVSRRVMSCVLGDISGSVLFGLARRSPAYRWMRLGSWASVPARRPPIGGLVCLKVRFLS